MNFTDIVGVIFRYVARWLLHIDLFMYVFMQKGGLNIHLMDDEVKLRGSGE